jgi:hypothetical protein
MIKIGLRSFFDGAAEEIGQTPIVEPTASYDLRASQAIIGYTSQNVKLLLNTNLKAIQTTIEYTGQSVKLLQALTLKANQSTIEYSGQNVEVALNTLLKATQANIEYSGQAVDLELVENNFILLVEAATVLYQSQNCNLIQRYITAPTESIGPIFLELPKTKKKIKIKREIITKEVIKEVIKEVPDHQVLLLLYQEKLLVEKEKERADMLEDALQAFVSGAI